VAVVSWRRGLFRLWLVLSICWVGAAGYQDLRMLCASYSPKAAKEREEKQRAEFLECLKTTSESACKPHGFDLGPAPGFPGFDQQNEWNATEQLFGPDGCLPRGEYRPDWSARWEVLPRVLGPPALTLIVGLVLIWVGRGFRRDQ
jgi:hypothetical protein